MGKMLKTMMLVLLLLACCLQVHASTTGSITVALPTAGGTLALYRVGQLTQENGAILTESFASSNVELADLHDPDAAASLADFIRDTGLSGSVLPVEPDGTVVFSDLQEGVYLVIQQEAPQGQLPISPFLVVIPEAGNYAVEARPKTQPEPTTPDSTTPETGDRSAWLLIPAAACMVFSGAGAALCLYLHKDRRS